MTRRHPRAMADAWVSEQGPGLEGPGKYRTREETSSRLDRISGRMPEYLSIDVPEKGAGARGPGNERTREEGGVSVQNPYRRGARKL